MQTIPSVALDNLPDVLDVVVLGAGGAGYPGALFLARAGKLVLMIDPVGNMGGNCLAEGCVPSKAVREAALLKRASERWSHFGLQGAGAEVDWSAVLAHKDRVQEIRYAQHRQEILSSGVLFVQGQGAISAPTRVRVTAADGSVREVGFRHLMLATGSQPVRLPIPGAELALTSRDLFRLGANMAQPEHLVVVGGGYIGVETASMLQAFGSNITILEFSRRVLVGFDEQLAGFLQQQLAQRVRIEVSAQVSRIERFGRSMKVYYRQQGKELEIEGDAVLMATGRAPVLPDGVERLGLTLERGYVSVDDTIRSSNPQVWAPGDVNGRSMLFHSAVRQSVVAAHNIVAGGLPVDRMNFAAVPMTVFTEPELAHIGLDVERAQAMYGAENVTHTHYDYQEDSRAQIYGETHGFIKLVFHRHSTKLLGAQIAGMDAAHLIAPLAQALSQGLDAEAIAKTVFPHPMISEGIAKAARALWP